MARSGVRTWLPLDRWAEIVGLNPLHFNQLSGGKTLTPDNICGDVWFQHSWQHADRVGREDVAMAIQIAEGQIAAEVGFNLLPDWTIQERLEFAEPAIPGVYNLYGTNPRGMLNSIELRRGHIISGGVRASAAIQIGAAIVRTDPDGDGYNEHCVVIVPTTVTDPNEIRAYYPGTQGQDAWEIRPILVTLGGGNAVIEFNIWQVPAAGETEDLKAKVLDALDPLEFETLIDVYRVYNDPSTQVQFMWESDAPDCCGSCVACQFGTQTGCFHLRDERIGMAVPAPASWNAATGAFDSGEWSACRAPDQVRFWYYSGYQDLSLRRPKVEMAPYWEYAVAFYASSILDRPVCGCSNVQQFIDKWRRNLLVNDKDDSSFNVTPEMLSNKLGTSMGALYAYKRIHQNGMRVVK